MKNNDYQNWSKAELIGEIKRLKKRKKYGLVWEEKKEDVVEFCKDKLPVVKEIKNKAIITDKNKPVNLLIEGDNYHALSVLNYTHEKKIDVIYIDPPYNTGNKDFIFNDKYVDGEDSYRHSKWLSFMSKRLKLAKNLLKQTGVIFISIDDNEIAQLKSLMDNPNLFGEQNHLGTITWVKRTKPVNSGKARYQIQQNIEYLLCYSRTKRNLFPGFCLKLQGSRIYSHSGKFGKCRLVDIEDSDYGRKGRETMKFPILEILPGKGKRWKIGKKEVERLIKNNRIEIVNGKAKRAIYPEDEQREVLRPFWSHLELKDTGTAETGKEELSNILGKDHGLDTVKPKGLIKELLVHFSKDVLVLDFFAGSGTTAHAVLEANNIDNGERRFILCTDNEGSIMDKICYPRIKKVIGGYSDLKGRKVEGLGGNLKYFKTTFVDAEPTDKNKKKLTEQATEMLCIKEGTFELVLKRKHFKIFKNSNHYTGIIFDQLAIPEFKKVIKDIKGKFSIYVFSLSDETFDEEFADIKQNIKLSPIPEAILRVYRRIFR